MENNYLIESRILLHILLKDLEGAKKEIKKMDSKSIITLLSATAQLQYLCNVELEDRK